MIALITLSVPGARIAGVLAPALPDAKVYLHDSVNAPVAAERFSRTLDLVTQIFSTVRGLVFIAPCGVAVRAVAPHIRDKRCDPAAVVVDVGGRHVVSLLGGHEGGANDLALVIGNLLDAEPVISTTSEAAKDIIVGIGCRRGTPAQTIVEAVRTVLADAGIALVRVRYLSTADVKRNEPGMREAARELGVGLRIVSSERIRAAGAAVTPSAWVKEKVNLPAVAEPAALLAGWRTSLIRKRTIINSVTVAIAQENFSWSASVPADPVTAPGGLKKRSHRAP
jgi:cobalt-precorrin 5A hydrolase